MSDCIIDVRTLEPIDRHPTIFQTFSTLKTGEALVIINDHDPRPLYKIFDTELAGIFSWEYQEKGPIWRVRIGKIANSSKVVRSRGCGCATH